MGLEGCAFYLLRTKASSCPRDLLAVLGGGAEANARQNSQSNR